jgi:hypothetical protein
METGKIGPERENTKHRMLGLDMLVLMPLLLLMDIFLKEEKINFRNGKIFYHCRWWARN